MKKNRRQRGQLLIEAIVSMTLVTIIITGIVTALIYSSNNSEISKDQNLATQYAQEGLDIARGIKDSDFSTFSSLTGYYNLPDGYTVISSSNPPDKLNGRFTRQIYINQLGRDATGSAQCTNSPSAFVASIVKWYDTTCINGASCHKAELDSCFTDPGKVFY